MNELNLDAMAPDYDVFIDSNIFTYHLLGHRKYRTSVKEFLFKVESGVYNGYINEVVISEVYHNVLRVKICNKFNIKPARFAQFIKSNPEAISDVDLDMVSDVLSMNNLQLVMGIKVSLVRDYITRYNLLSSDAIHAATCTANGIEHMATNDHDFERVDFLTLWNP